MPKRVYFKRPEEAEIALSYFFRESHITNSGRIGGPECPETYQGNGREIVQEIPESQLEYSPKKE